MPKPRSRNSIDHRQLRAINARRILDLLRQRGPLSRREMVALTGLDPKSITNLVNYLLEEEYIQKRGVKKSERGWSVTVFYFREDRNLALGLSVEAHKVQAIITNLQGDILVHKANTLDPTNVGSLRQAVLELAEEMLRENKEKRKYIVGIGLCAPGLLDPNRQSCILSHQIPELAGAVPANWFREKWDIPFFFENISRAKALAERNWGWGREYPSFLLMDLDTGIGSGIILENRIFRGASGRSGEFGHFKMYHQSPTKNSTGQAERLESIVGADYICRQINQGRTVPVKSFQEVVELAREGEPAIRESLQSAGEWMGEAIANLYDFFDLPICLTGLLMEGGKWLVEPLEQRFAETVLVPGGRLFRAQVGEPVAPLGSAALVYYSLFDEIEAAT